jgi:Amt family ammonium transporter
MGATLVFAGLGTLLICVLVEKSLGFRIDAESEARGLDQALHGERGYDLA